jgi:hypothetical protein
VIGQAMCGGLEDPRSSTGGVYLREDMGLLGAIFDFHILGWLCLDVLSGLIWLGPRWFMKQAKLSECSGS